MEGEEVGDYRCVWSHVLEEPVTKREWDLLLNCAAGAYRSTNMTASRAVNQPILTNRHAFQIRSTSDCGSEPVPGLDIAALRSPGVCVPVDSRTAVRNKMSSASLVFETILWRPVVVVASVVVG